MLGRRGLKNLIADESGATAVEYALILAAIAAVIMAMVFIFGGKVRGQYDSVQQGMP